MYLRNNKFKSIKYLSNKLKLVILIEMALTELLLKSLLSNKFKLKENLGAMSNTLDVNHQEVPSRSPDGKM